MISCLKVFLGFNCTKTIHILKGLDVNFVLKILDQNKIKNEVSRFFSSINYIQIIS